MARHKFETPMDVVDAIDELYSNAVVRHYDHRSDESLTECRVCGEWEGHAAECPIPAIQRWLGEKP